MAALASQPKPSPLADTAYRIVSATVDACHRYNDFTDRAWEIGWLHSVFDDDTLLNETERQQFKAWIIDREMRPKSGNFTEIFNAVLNIAEITGIVSSGKVMKLPKLTPSQRLDFKRALDKLNCDPKAIEEILKKASKNAKKIHAETGIKFDKNGFPYFGKLIKVNVKISGDLTNMTSQAHQKAATKVLRDLINSGSVKKELFTPNELEDIMRGNYKIGKYTWHHHQELGRMQLVPSDVHGKVQHIGGNAIWGMKKK